MNGYLRISARVSAIWTTIPGTVGSRSGCGTGQSGVMGSAKIAIMLLVMVFPDASSAKLCITVRLLLALPEWRLLFAAGCVSVPRARAKCFVLLMAPV